MARINVPLNNIDKAPFDVSRTYQHFVDEFPYARVAKISYVKGLATGLYVVTADGLTHRAGVAAGIMCSHLILDENGRLLSDREIKEWRQNKGWIPVADVDRKYERVHDAYRKFVLENQGVGIKSAAFATTADGSAWLKVITEAGMRKLYLGKIGKRSRTEYVMKKETLPPKVQHKTGSAKQRAYPPQVATFRLPIEREKERVSEWQQPQVRLTTQLIPIGELEQGTQEFSIYTAFQRQYPRVRILTKARAERGERKFLYLFTEDGTAHELFAPDPNRIVHTIYDKDGRLLAPELTKKWSRKNKK